jgi:hypothetical protein
VWSSGLRMRSDARIDQKKARRRGAGANPSAIWNAIAMRRYWPRRKSAAALTSPCETEAMRIHECSPVRVVASICGDPGWCLLG